MRTGLRRFSLLALLALTACGGGHQDAPAEGKGEPMHISGVVKYRQLEGGFYVIEGEDGATYDPTNLSPEFRREGLAVEIKARRRPDMTSVRQTGNIIDIERIRERAPAAAPPAASLGGTAWQLEDLGGRGIIDNSMVTLEFPEAGRVAGRGGCNRFFGSVELDGESIKFGQMGATRMACAEALMDQESRYLKALESAQRYTLSGDELLLHGPGLDKPLRFTRRTP